MAFWKHFGKKLNHGEKTRKFLEKTIPNRNENNNDKVLQPSDHTVSLAANGDLGESLYSELYCNSNGQISPTISGIEVQMRTCNGDFGDLGNDISTAELIKPRNKKSRLLKNLQEILIDLTALSYFQQYLESRNAATFLTILNDIKNCNLLANSLSACSGGTSSFTVSSLAIDETIGPETKWSPTRNESKTQRLMNSTSSSSGFSDDTSLESPGHVPLNSNRHLTTTEKPSETDTLIHSLHSEQRRIIEKYFDPESSDYLISIAPLIKPPSDVSPTDPGAFTVESILGFLRDVQESVLNLLDHEFLPDYLHSEFHYRYQLEILTGGKLCISDILYNETCLFYFMEFMDQEGKRHWLEFWLAANNFRSQWNSQNASADALIIYNKYFSLQASQSLGLSDVIRSSIEENICCSESGPPPDCFEHAVHVVLSTMEKKYFHKFLASQVYHQYLTEVISTFKNSTVATLSRSKRSGSDSTINSEMSGISSNAPSTIVSNTPNMNASLSAASNTGLSHAESTMVRLINNISNESLVIDIRQLNDPDSLWKRKKYNLSLGYLTPLGRFHTEIEPQPDKKSESRLTKAVRKFVLVEEEQEKEEAAWKVAEMIIRDVTSVTLHYLDRRESDSSVNGDTISNASGVNRYE